MAVGERVLPDSAVGDLPEALDGAAFLDRWGATDDDVTTVDPAETYPVAAATRFGVEEHLRSEARARGAGQRRRGCARPTDGGESRRVRRDGAGHRAATAAVAELLDREGVHGARSSAGGSGGTVVAVCWRARSTTFTT